MRKILILFGALLALMLFYSCASAPEPVPEPDPEKPAPTVRTEPVKPSVPLPEAEHARAEELRGHIDTYGLARYASVDFERGEEAFARGEAAYGMDNAEARDAFIASADAYEKVIEAGAAAIRKEKEDALLAGKKAADAVDASRHVSARYQQAETAAAEALAAYRSASGTGDYGKYVEAAAAADDAAHLYEIARLEVLVRQRQAVIDRYDLREHLPRNQYEGANTQLAKGRSLAGTDNAAAVGAYRAAVSGFEEAIESAAKRITANSRKAADGSRNEADSLKAAVAVKEPYRDAADVYGRAAARQRDAERASDKEKMAISYHEAVVLYEDAAERFGEVTAVAREKRARALEAMQRARQDVEAAQDHASEAEKVIQQGTL